MSTDPETPAAPPAAPPAPSPPPPAPPRRLRRSATDRVGAGVAGGLGEYAGVDPVLFRVLFAVAAFFGGAGALAYAVAWAVIPVEGTEHAPVDGWVDGLRRHHIPPWLVAAVGCLLLWAVAFSWWSPHPPWPLLALVLVPLLLFGSRDGGWRRPVPTAPSGSSAAGEASGSAEAPAVRLDKGPTAAPPAWATEARAWLGRPGRRRAHGGGDPGRCGWPRSRRWRRR